jgi:hypothetical protein
MYDARKYIPCTLLPLEWEADVIATLSSRSRSKKFKKAVPLDGGGSWQHGMRIYISRYIYIYIYMYLYIYIYINIYIYVYIYI